MRIFHVPTKNDISKSNDYHQKNSRNDAKAELEERVVNYRKDKEKKIAKKMEKILERLDQKKPQKRKKTIVDVDRHSPPFANQFTSQRNVLDKTKLNVQIKQLGNVYEMTIQNQYGQLITTCVFAKSEKHKMFERWKYLTNEEYRKHKQEILERNKNGEQLGLKCLKNFAFEINKQMLTQLPRENEFDQIPTLIDRV